MEDLKTPGASRAKLQTRRYVVCAHCGRQVERRSRQQQYCSDRCRARDHEQGRNRTRKAELGGSTSAPNAAIKNHNEYNGLKGRNSGSSDYAKAPFNLFGGGQRQLPGAVPLDADLRRKILRAEVGTA